MSVCQSQFDAILFAWCACDFLQSLGYIVEDIIHYAASIDREILPFVMVVIAERGCLVVVNVKTFLDGVDIVVSTPCLLATVEHTLHKFLLRHFKTDNGMKAPCLALPKGSFNASACGIVRGKPSKITPSFP